MQYIRVRNWEKFQQYKDRDPKWIKLYRGLNRNYEWSQLDEVARAHLVGIWLLAAELDNKVPNDPAWISAQIGAKKKIQVQQLVTYGFIELYEPVQECTEVYLEERREEEIREEKRSVAPKNGARLDVIRIFEHWKTTLNHPLAKLSEERGRLITKWLKTYSVEDLCKAIDGCAKTPHNIGQNDRHERYDGLGVILKNADNIDRFMGNASSAPAMNRGPL